MVHWVSLTTSSITMRNWLLTFSRTGIPLHLLITRKSSCGKSQEAYRPQRNQSWGGGGGRSALVLAGGLSLGNPPRKTCDRTRVPSTPRRTCDWTGVSPWKGHGIRDWDMRPEARKGLAPETGVPPLPGVD